MEGINEVYRFKTQHRMAQDADGRFLQTCCEPFKEPTPTRQAIAAVCDALQAATPTDFSPILKECPKVVVLRHSIRQKINRYLAVNHANQGFDAPRRLVVWRSYDVLEIPNYQPCALSMFPALNAAVAEAPGKKTGGIEAWCYFFEGIDYVFIDSERPEIGRAKNCWCTGVKIVLDPNEPVDDPTRPYRLLSFPPRAVIVRPHDMDVGTTCCDDEGLVPPGCIPVMKVNLRTGIDLPLPIPYTIDTPSGPVVLTSVHIKRSGIPLGDGYAVTDYFVQGMTFGMKPWMVHLTPTPDHCLGDDDGNLQRPGILVTLSRHPLWSRVRPIAPLWTHAAERESVINTFANAATMGADLVAFLARLEQQGALTHMKFAALRAVIAPAVAAADAARRARAVNMIPARGVQPTRNDKRGANARAAEDVPSAQRARS